MSRSRRKIEVFSAGCPVCLSVVDRVKELACKFCEVEVVDMKSPAGEKRVKTLGAASLPAVAIDSKLADCCVSRGVDERVLQAAGLGKPLSSGRPYQ